jgi:crotonobetaine/carnitine-CoA ligase
MNVSPTALAWEVLDHRAAAMADKDFLRFRDGSFSYARFAETASRFAAGLSRHGLGKGSVVPTFLANGGPAVATWFALMRLGAVWVPINTEFRGEQLAAAINATLADTIIVDGTHLELIQAVLPALTALRRVLVHDGPMPASGAIDYIAFQPEPHGDVPAVGVVRAEVAMIQFTSGSTGVSKAVQLSHGYLVGQARLASRYFDIRPSDTIYCPFPLYHWDATIGTVLGALVTGATAALSDRFSVSRFWDDIRAFDATMFDFMGASLTFLFEKPPTARDRDHRVRLAWGLPMPAFRAAFEQRFGFPLLEGYGSTEGGVAVFQILGATYPQGSCGRAAPEYDLKLVDDDGAEVPIGQVGEIATRPHDPTLMMNGYLDMPEVNAELIRDGYYFSGDLGRLDEAGNLYFEGRKKDIIRRRGENISALEVERGVESHPAVMEAAAFGAPSPYTEEEVAVAVVVRAGATLSDQDLRDHCAGRMARYMVPQHVLFLDALPKTPTAKVAKPELKRLFAQLQSRETPA